jgi:phosphotransferase family enzyme
VASAESTARPPREWEQGPSGPVLERCLQELFGNGSLSSARQERLKAGVDRLHVDIDGTARSLVIKRSAPELARRNWLLARRWLPAVGLEDHGPRLLAIAAEQTCEAAWLVFEDLPGNPVSSEPPLDGEIEAAIEAIARVHTAFAEHPLLRECRYWGGDRGMHFYSSNLRDAAIALQSLDVDDLGGNASDVRDALFGWIERLRRQEPQRAEVVASASGPETLVHGDLWPTNTVVAASGDGYRARLIDWDELGVGPIGFDLSTFLVRFDPSHRAGILAVYRLTVRRLAGWRLPTDRDLNSIFETAAYARLLSLLTWSVAAVEAGNSNWLLERLEGIVEWLDEVESVVDTR